MLELASANFDRKHGSTLAAMKSLERYCFAGVYSLSYPRNRCLVQAGIEVARMHPGHFLPAITQALARLVIDIDNGLVLVEQEETIRCVVDNAAIARLARAHPGRQHAHDQRSRQEGGDPLDVPR